VFVLLEDGVPDIAGSRSCSQQNECRTQGFRLHPNNSISGSKSPNPLSFSDIRHTKSVSSDLPLPQLHDAVQCFGFRPQTRPDQTIHHGIVEPKPPLPETSHTQAVGICSLHSSAHAQSAALISILYSEGTL
jgi:hypothetical protein